MSQISQRALEARGLLTTPAFQEIIGEIREEATRVFLDVNCDITAREAAHEKVRAVQTILDVIQSRIVAESIEKKRNQHRAND